VEREKEDLQRKLLNLESSIQEINSKTEGLDIQSNRHKIMLSFDEKYYNDEDHKLTVK
jgi:hypothetical protein